MTRGRCLVLLATLPFAAGCDDQDDIVRRYQNRQRTAAPPLALRDGGPALAATSPSAVASDLDAGADPAPGGGDLAADIERFTTVDACVATHRIEDAVLGDALVALGYDNFARDACKVLAAAKAKQPARCKELIVSTLQQHCLTLVATIAKEPELCPIELRGGAKDATCVALATRDVRLCAGESEARRPRCEAMLTRNSKRCVTAAPAERPTCARDAERWAGLLPDAKDRGALPAPTGAFSVSAKTGDPIVGKTSVDLALELKRGLVVLEERGAAAVRRIDVGSVPAGVPLFAGIDPDVRAQVELPPLEPGVAVTDKPAKLRSFEMVVPGRPTVSSPPIKSELTATWKKVELARGGALELTIEGTVGDPERLYAVKLEAKTFVRDIAPTNAPLKPLPTKPR